MSVAGKRNTLDVFPTRLGWIALIGSCSGLRQLVFGFRKREAAIGALDGRLLREAGLDTWDRQLAARLEAYAAGSVVQFCDVRLDLQGLTPFRRRVLQRCRRVPYGKTVTYGELAAAAGSPRAARSVGNCMAANPIPLVVPCHRVLAAGGRLGGYSAPGGTRTKRRLLAMEAAAMEIGKQSGPTPRWKSAWKRDPP